jgi:hypothetical protein
MTLTSTCPDQGAWRAWLDHEHGDPALDEHIRTCAACASTVDGLRASAATASDAVRRIGPTRLPTAAETSVARERLAWRQRRAAAAAEPPAEQPAAARPATPGWVARIPTPWRIAASGLAAALVLSVVVGFTDDGRTAAAAFLAQFRSQQVTAVTVSPQSQADLMRTLTALGNLGTVKTPTVAARPGGALPRLPEAQPATLTDAAAKVGFPLKTPDSAALPAGMNTTPQVQVIPANEIRFTFDKTKAAEYYRANGHPEVTLPDRFDGATLVISTPAAAVMQYGNKDSRDALVIAQSGELVVNAEGNVSLDELRDFILGLPGLPKEVTDQFKQIKDWNQTLAIPIPTDKVNWKSERIKGADALLLNDNTGVGSAAIWHADNHLYGVAGTLKANDIKKIAESLH